MRTVALPATTRTVLPPVTGAAVVASTGATSAPAGWLPPPGAVWVSAALGDAVPAPGAVSPPFAAGAPPDAVPMALCGTVVPHAVMRSAPSTRSLDARFALIRA